MQPGLADSRQDKLRESKGWPLPAPAVGGFESRHSSHSTGNYCRAGARTTIRNARHREDGFCTSILVNSIWEDTGTSSRSDRDSKRTRLGEETRRESAALRRSLTRDRQTELQTEKDAGWCTP